MANNRIQIKRSATTATPSALLPGELAFSNVTGGSGVLFIGDTSNSTVVAIGGVRNPGVLTANQALVANSISAIDKVIVANLVPTVVWANGAGGSSGDVLTSNGSGVYWRAPSAGVAGSDTQVQFNDNGNLAGDAGLTYNKTSDTLSTNSIFATSTVNAATIQVGTSVVANSSRLVIGTAVGLQVNGTIGTAGQILYSNGTTGYWAAPPTGDITGVSAGNGLTGGGTSGDVTLDVAAGNGISVSADAVAVLANNGIIANTSGLFADAANGISVTADGINVLAGNSQIISNASGVFVNSAALSIATSQLSGDVALGTQTSGNYVATIAAGNGISGSASSEGATPTIAVVANNGIVSNSTGVWAKSGNGIVVDAGGINVLGNTGVTVNSTGVHIGQAVETTSSVTFANVVTTDLTVNGNTKLGDATSDVVQFVARVNTAIVPSANQLYDLGSNLLRWANVYANSITISGPSSIGGNVSIDGTLTVTGNLVTQNVQSVIVSDPMIYLAGNNYTSDLLDIGFAANYNDGSTNRHTGLFRDHTDGIYKLFFNLTQELSGNNDVDTGDASYRVATLQAYLSSGALTTNSSSANLVANSTVSVAITANVLTLSGRSNNDLLFHNGSAVTGLALNTTGGYVLQTNGTAIVYDYLDGGTF